MFGNNTEKFVFHQRNNFPLQLYLSTRSLPKSNHTFLIHHRRCLRLACQTICIHFICTFVEMIMHAIALDTSKTNRLFKPHCVQHVILRQRTRKWIDSFESVKLRVAMKIVSFNNRATLFSFHFSHFSASILFFSANCAASKKWYYWVLVCRCFLAFKFYSDFRSYSTLCSVYLILSIGQC